MRDVKVSFKWWVFDQNNSGGYFIQNDDVTHYVAIQAVDVKHAQARAEDIFCGYSEYCDCCGERWSLDYADEEDGTEVPEVYGTPYTEFVKSHYRQEIILHYVDGSKEKYKFKDKAE